MLALLLALLLSQAHAASFDCAHAATATERRICADPRLSRGDAAVAAAYASALAVTPREIDLRDGQRAWLADRDKAPDAATLQRDMASRAAALTAMAVADEAARKPVNAADVATRCIAPAHMAPHCRVEHQGALPNGLLWQLRRYDDDSPAMRIGAGVMVLRAAGGQAIPLVWNDQEGARFEAPELIAIEGDVLDLQGAFDGTGDFSAETIYARQGDGWRQIDMDPIVPGMLRFVPRGLEIWKGVYPDWKAMTAESGLWRQDDANCCPTGGWVKASLARDGFRIVVRHATYDPKTRQQ